MKEQTKPVRMSMLSTPESVVAAVNHLKKKNKNRKYLCKIIDESYYLSYQEFQRIQCKKVLSLMESPWTRVYIENERCRNY